MKEKQKNLRLALIIGLRLALCPGDDILVLTTAATMVNNKVDVAILTKEPKVVTIYERTNTH